MVSINWTKEALRNLKEIKDYVSKDSTYYAERLIKQLYNSVKMLRNHPEAGMLIVVQKGISIRRLIVKSYRIVYAIHNNNVYIITVFHQLRKAPDTFNTGDLFG